ncbi:MAG: 16S rRNA (adenine(1518)-N(6)/adenine(1519)-N(6))-dimethyltransferase RsmA [Rhodospirillales bacterium]|nr:16S rRNA (adenine(1518)-N(6)/adenine(1519)-N(6))-dimethyltransferase RsmA [Rhodospirillales bacterium]
MTEPAPLRDIIKRYGLGARKSLGQHFLLDRNLCARIARTAGDLTGVHVIEIGPGPGGLTRALLDTGAETVSAVEMDTRCVEALAELRDAYPKRLKIVEADALETDVTALSPAPRRIVANLPYNVATPLLLGWLGQIGEFESLTLMFQKEVADRLAAEPGGKTYGRLSVLVQWLCEVRFEFNVSKQVFTPPPKVASSIVTLTPRPQPLAPAERNKLEAVTAMAFGQRRKMLRSSLKPLNLDFDALGITPTARAEELTVEQFCAIARSVAGTVTG